MTIRGVELDFLRTAHRASLGGVVVLAAGVAAAFMVLSLHADLKDEAQRLESRAAKFERRVHGLSPVGMHVDESMQQEIHRANEVIDQLALPWERLFHSLEGATTERVALLGIAPDAKSGTVQISAEAVDSEAMFEYVGRLERQRELSQVYLLQHLRDQRAGARPLRFTVIASWMQR
ncbi:MAG TPA: hypothetical protein VFB20_07115 [Burkholderiales bacterium]|nr:hypothetical protein [Burkholderiales bacterium]